MLDLELHHHFIYRYSRSLVPVIQARDQVFERILELGLSHDFLMHSLLALSALHLYHLYPSRSELFERACYLQGVAIQHVQPIIANLTQDDAIAALMFSSHTAAFGLAEFMLNPNHDGTDPIDKIIECFQLSRGIKVIVSPHWGYLVQTWMHPLFDSPKGLEEKARASVASRFSTYSMVRSLAFGQDDPERRQCCLSAVEDVFAFIDITFNHRDQYLAPTYLIDGWVVQLPLAFKDMLVERKPIALIILAYWAVMTSINPRPWHLEGLAQVLIARIEMILGPEWSEFLRWPKEKIMENSQAAREDQDVVSRIDNSLSDMHLRHQTTLGRPTDEISMSQPSPYNSTSNHISPYSAPSNQPSPYIAPSSHASPFPPASTQLSPYHAASHQPSPYSPGPPTS